MLPKIQVESVRRVYNDGNHNAFTDLCRFQDRFYLTFRSCPEGHMIFDSSEILVLASKDAQEWEIVFRFGVPDRDVRDPHFLIFQSKLFVYTGTWLVGPEAPRSGDLNDHLGYCAWTEDGIHWQGPRALEGTKGHYIWRAAAYKDTAYLCGRRKRGFAHTSSREEAMALTEAALLGSPDGFSWHTVGLFLESYGDETAFLFEDDGSILAIVRGRLFYTSTATLCRAAPPYQKWIRRKLNVNIGGPLLAKWGDLYLVGGREAPDPEHARTVLYWLENDQLIKAAELPSGGDNSYPGFVALSPERGLLSYYSSHEGSGTALPPSAIYLAELSLQK
ncbi:MAG: hypothetical protein J7M05_00350 [Anaerolineae bacterium]|nr:hypothetical protein [Anaerolineae bacterium]